MDLGKLILNKYLSYDHAEIDFNGMGKALIVGMNNGDTFDSNGSGKTNLFESIGWNGWGESKAETIDLNVKEGEDSCSVEHQFRHDGKDVIIIRARNKKNGSTTLDFIIDGVVSNGANVTETNKKISEFLNLDYETFVNSVYIRQDDVYSLANSKNTSAGRDLLEKVLNLQVYEGPFLAAKEKLKDLDQQRLKIAEFAELYKDADKSRKDIIDSIGLITNRKTKLELSIAASQSALAESEIQYESLRDQEFQYSSLAKDLEKLEAELIEATDALNDVRQKAINFKAEQDAKVIQLEKKIEAESDLFREKTLIEAESSNSKSKAKDIRDLEQKMADFDLQIKVQKNLFDGADRDIELRGRNISHIQNIDIAPVQMKIQNPDIKDGDICDHCLTPLTQNNLDHYIEALQEKIGPYEKKVTALQAEQANAIKERDIVLKKIETIESIKNTINTQIKTIKQSFQSEEVLDLKLRSVQERLLEINRIRKELENIQSGTALSDWKDTVKKKKQHVTDTQVEIEKAKSDLAGINIDTDKLSGIKSDISDMRELIHQDQLKLFDGDKNMELLKKNQNDFDIIIEQKKTKAKELAEIDKEHSIYSDLAMAFSSQGIRSYILENAIDELEREANSILSRLSSNRLSLEFKTKKEVKKSKQEKLTFEVLINDGQKTFPFTSYSGGQKFRISFVLRVALSKLLLRRAHSKLEFLIIDEAVSPLDGRGVEQIIEVINELQNEFKTILVITHRNDVKQYFEKIITVNMTPNGSVLEK